MAIADLLERLSGGNAVEEDPDIPDDVSELDDQDLLDPDPSPVRKSRPKLRAAAPPRVTAGQRRTVKDAWTTLFTVPAGVVSLRDPICGGAALDQVDALAEALTKVTARNPAMLAWFLGDAAPWLDWMAVVMAARPIVTTIWGHHVSHTIGQEDENAQVDYSAYNAPQFSG